MYYKWLSTAALSVLILASCGNTSSISDQITLRYAGWNLGTETGNNIERQMLAAYEAANPNIKIEIIERPFKIDEETGEEVAATWNEFFATQAATNQLPDVYMIYDLAGFTAQGWTEEVTDLFEADTDFSRIPSSRFC